MLLLKHGNLPMVSVSEALRTLTAVQCYSVDYIELFRCVGAAIPHIMECIISDEYISGYNSF